VALEKVLARKEQALLYLNRLGYSHIIYCEDCGFSWRCRNCDVGLTYYKNSRRLKCHYCGLFRTVPARCEKCEGTHIETMGFGTEQVEKTLSQRFPNARIARMDRSVIGTKKELESLMERIASRDVDLIVGTQMVAKGHDFPAITLVGILVADASLMIPDFRSYERTFQILTQVSGRAGRALLPGEVFIQSFRPDHTILEYAGAGKSREFFNAELDLRRRNRFPPFVRLALVRFQHKNASKVSGFARECAHEVLRSFTERGIHVSLLGPSEAPLGRLNNYFRWHFLLKAPSVTELKKALSVINEVLRKTKTSVQSSIDVDPINAM
jgi:primosomal protein N' (replication factor Y)